LNNVVEALEQIVSDEAVPRNLCQKLESLIEELKSSEKLSLIINRSISELEEISSDVNLPSVVKTQLWAVMGLLEQLEAEIVENS